ncbi:hypothetical protein JG688_00018634 [Phytophthora aleatoria]|uniref:Uncharacterized protein n=1 Tax=Phytophthora aleatoria TaxID=2496075 RepID=A0A8J5IAK8_9STRA|nr:hypothetical protein JG688_00018634 [Phytophthora aleatoria]
MASNDQDPSRKYGKARLVVDAADLESTRELGLLRESVVVLCEDSSSPTYGVDYDRQANIADHEFSCQQSVRASVKDFAVSCGFQIFVQQTSVKRNNSGSAKYQCKNLNGAQFFDQETPLENIQCPFFVNVFGLNGRSRRRILVTTMPNMLALRVLRLLKARSLDQRRLCGTLLKNYSG